MTKIKSSKKPSRSPNSFPEISFIICRHRKSQPKISPLICEQRCHRIKACQEYFDYLQPAMFERVDKREAREKGEGLSIPVGEDTPNPGNSFPGGKTTRRRP